MSDAEEPVFTSLAARKAALNQSQTKQHQTFGKRPPPPVPTSRPTLQSRGQTTNNPPIATYGSSVTKQSNNLPNSVKANLLPPPPVDRDRPASPGRSPSLPTRNVPPPLPGRKDSQLSPSVPARRGPQNGRRGSGSSTISVSSTMSVMSLGQGSSATSGSSIGEGRKMPPPLEHAKLPPLPPTRREREEAEKLANAKRAPLVTTKSAPNGIREPPVVERDLAPKVPARPSLPSRPGVPPRVPSRPNDAEESRPVQPPRRLPPPAAATRNALSMGFNNKKKETPTPIPNLATRPGVAAFRPTGPAVQELGSRDFDRVIMAGTPALVYFYAPFCKYCKELDPTYQELGQLFAFASDMVIIAKVDVHEHKSFMDRYDIQGYPTLHWFDGRNESPEPYPYGWKLEPFTKWIEKKTGISAADGPGTSVPPPINLRSKPALAEVKAIISRPAAPPAPTSGCNICRDYSEPDRIAEQYPRHTLPRGGDMTAYLADVLCSPFESHTDKARAIFTWLHHNIAYDTGAFFSNNVKHVTPADVVSTGLAVCGGYAGLYVAIALKAGMESVMVTGHGKGYGYTPLKPGDPIPPREPDGHAWNAVRIDGGEWKLLDACWGAGNVNNQQYNKLFTASEFTMSNDEFGIKHFPQDDAYFFRSDGGVQTWEDYMIGPVGTEAVQLYSVMDKHGLGQTSFSPPQKHIPTNSSSVVRFQFSRACEHWDNAKHGTGKPYLFLLNIKGLDGRKEDWIPFENNDFWYWIDIKACDLGAPGQAVGVYAVSSFDNKDGRGLTRREFLNRKGKCAMGPFEGICTWDLV